MLNISMDAYKIWKTIKEELVKNDIIFSDIIDNDVYAESFENGILRLEIEKEEAYKELEDNVELIEEIANNRFGIFGINISLELQKRYIYDEIDLYNEISKNDKFKSNLDESFTLDNYIIGDNNEYAYNLGLALVEGNFKYNPILIYGESGLGKTHLAQAIGNKVYQNDRNKKILYITSSEFSNQLIMSFTSKTTMQFGEMFRKLDMLIVDDIQFFEKMFGRGDDKAQKEFYDVFNALQMANKPVVLISDRYPDRIQNVDARLTSRFISGVSVELKMPDKSVRMGIIKNLANKDEIIISDELVAYIADSMETNIRDLIGFMSNIIALLNIKHKTEVTKEMVDYELSKRILKKKNLVTKDRVIDIVVSYYGIKRENVLNKGRNKEFVRARDVIRYTLSKQLGMNLTDIGAIFGTDHSAVIKAIRKIEAIEASDIKDEDSKKLLEEIEEIIKKVENI